MHFFIVIPNFWKCLKTCTRALLLTFMEWCLPVIKIETVDWGYELTDLMVLIEQKFL